MWLISNENEKLSGPGKVRIMQEAEVSLRVGIYHIIHGLTKEDVLISIDGAHIRTKNQVNFDIWSFFKDNGLIKIDKETERWQGKYLIRGYEPCIEIVSKPGIGDVNVTLSNGKKLLIESKKGKESKSGLEYPLMREAIGQLMTVGELGGNIVPVVAVPYSEKTYSLAKKWSEYSQIKRLGLKFYLVEADGNMIIV